MKLFLATFGLGVASALFPLINMEVFLAGVGALVDQIGIWPVSVTAAAGQTIGKILWYEFGRSSLRWRYLAKKMKTRRWQRNYNKVKSRTDDQPWNAMGLSCLSRQLLVCHPSRSLHSSQDSCASTGSCSASPR